MPQPARPYQPGQTAPLPDQFVGTDNAMRAAVATSVSRCSARNIPFVTAALKAPRLCPPLAQPSLARCWRDNLMTRRWQRQPPTPKSVAFHGRRYFCSRVTLTLCPSQFSAWFFHNQRPTLLWAVFPPSGSACRLGCHDGSSSQSRSSSRGGQRSLAGHPKPAGCRLRPPFWRGRQQTIAVMLLSLCSLGHPHFCVAASCVIIFFGLRCATGSFGDEVTKRAERKFT